MRKCNLQKTISFLLSLVMVLGMCIVQAPETVKAADGPQVTASADKQELRRGEQVTVTAVLSGNTEAFGLDYVLNFDTTRLKLVKIDRGAAFEGAFVGMLNPEADEVEECKGFISAVIGMSKNAIQNSTVFTAVFEVLDDAEIGKAEFTSEVSATDGAEIPNTLQVNGNNIAVSVVNPATGIALDKKNLDMAKGQTEKLTATLTPADANSAVTWKSSNEAVATVTNDGTVTAVSGGKATITATAGGLSASCEVNVGVPMNGISIENKDVKVNRGKTVELKVNYDPADTTADKTVAWKSDNEAVATVDSATGVVTGVKAGEANITVTTTKTAKPLSATVKVTVEENSIKDEQGLLIAFDKMEKPILKGNNGQTVFMGDFLNIEKVLADNNITDTYSIVWSSSDEKVATVDRETGKVVGVKEGKARITAVITFTNGVGEKTGEYTVTTEIEVKEIPLESIAFNKVIKEMVVGTTETLSIIYNPENTTDLKDVTWETSDASIISVDNGKLTALKAGEAEITAKVGEKSVSCKITVKESSSSLKPGQTDNGNGSVNNTKVSNTKAGVKTGDTANVALYAVMLLVSLGAVLVFYKKRNSRVRR
jgi:LPXTG-motif cell wall-anchored protein